MTSPVPSLTVSPAQDFVGKRLKALRKRITKIDNYPSENLNEDQLAAIAKKPELVAAAKELEDVAKQLSVAEEEQAAADAARAKEVEEGIEARVRDAVSVSEALWADKIKQVLHIQYSLSVVLASYAATSASLSEAEYAGLVALRSNFLAPIMDLSTEFSPLMYLQFDLVQKLLNKSEETFLETGLTFADLAVAIEKLTTPSPAVKFGAVEEQAPVAIVEDEQVVPETVVPQSASIRFFAANEEQDASATTLLAETETVSVAEPVKPVESSLPEVDVAGAEAAVAALELDAPVASESEAQGWAADVPTDLAPAEPAAEAPVAPAEGDAPADGEEKPREFKKRGPWRGRGRGGFRGRGGPRPFYPRENRDQAQEGEGEPRQPREGEENRPYKPRYNKFNNNYQKGPQVDADGFILAGSNKSRGRGGFRGRRGAPFQKRDAQPAPATGAVAPAHS